MKKYFPLSLFFLCILAYEVMAICTTEYNPVCGRLPDICNGNFCASQIPGQKTFSNRCELENARATFLYEGECKATPDFECRWCGDECVRYYSSYQDMICKNVEPPYGKKCVKDNTESNCVIIDSPGCTDSENGKDYFLKGEVHYCFIGAEEPGDSQGMLCSLHEDLCSQEDNLLFEQYCEGDELKVEQYFCSNGCKEGACLKPEICSNEYDPVCGIPHGAPCPSPEEIEGEVGPNCINSGPPTTYSNMCELEAAGAIFRYKGECGSEVCKELYWYDDSNKECSSKQFCGAYMYRGLHTFESLDECKKQIDNTECNGCSYEQKCLPISTRINKQYCDYDNLLKSQKLNEEECENNYECLSNSCNSGLCTDFAGELKETRNLIQRLWDWLKNIF